MVFMYLFTFFGILALIAVSPILGIFVLLSGSPVANVTLPYNPEAGLVWEYDNFDDPYLKLEKMTVAGDKQIFLFVSSIESNDEIDYYNGRCMELVFTSENGQTETYYAYLTETLLYYQVFIEPEENTLIYTTTVTRDEADSECEWKMDFLHSDSDNVLYFSDNTGTENEFTIVHFEDRPAILEASFFYENADGHNVWHLIEVDFTSGEPVIVFES